MNLQIYQLSNQIKELVSSFDLPVGIVYYIVKDLYEEIETLYFQQVENEMNGQFVSNSNTAEEIKGFTPEEETNNE